MELKKLITAGSVALTVSLFGCGDEKKEEKATETEKQMEHTEGSVEQKADEKMQEPTAPEAPATPEQSGPAATSEQPAASDQPATSGAPAASEEKK